MISWSSWIYVKSKFLSWVFVCVAKNWENNLNALATQGLVFAYTFLFCITMHLTDLKKVIQIFRQSLITILIIQRNCELMKNIRELLLFIIYIQTKKKAKGWAGILKVAKASGGLFGLCTFLLLQHLTGSSQIRACKPYFCHTPKNSSKVFSPKNPRKVTLTSLVSYVYLLQSCYALLTYAFFFFRTNFERHQSSVSRSLQIPLFGTLQRRPNPFQQNKKPQVVREMFNCISFEEKIDTSFWKDSNPIISKI